ncbi:MAG: LTA synthase family protein, partial [Bacteriovoracaceae bacterium]
STSLFINQAALNGMITFEQAYKLRQRRNVAAFKIEEEMGYTRGIHEAFSDYLGFDTTPTDQSQLVNLLQRRTGLNDELEKRKPHVVVFVMESFGGNWLQYNSEEFDFLGPLKAHIDEDIYFKNFISSENGTIGSLMVLASNLPPRPGARFLSESRYMQLPLPSAAHLPYKEKGYETRFVYGGKLGWRGIGKYFQIQDYHHVEGESHIKKALALKGDVGNEWGLYDEHLFKHIEKKLEKAQRPQFMLVLTTSNHPPFDTPEYFHPPGQLSIPDKLRPRISREEDLFLKRFRAFQYSNTVLSQFLSTVKEGELAQNTVVAFTGDHNFWGFMSYGLDESYLKYQVPFYVYAPEEIRPKSFDHKKLGSHEDIFPTLYNLTLSGAPYVAFGENLFSLNPSYAIGSGSAAGEEGMFYKGNNYAWETIPRIKEKTDQRLEKVSKAYRSSVSVADFYLRQIYKKFHSLEEKE